MTTARIKGVEAATGEGSIPAGSAPLRAAPTGAGPGASSSTTSRFARAGLLEAAQSEAERAADALGMPAGDHPPPGQASES